MSKPPKRNRALPEDASPDAEYLDEVQFRRRYPIGHSMFHKEIKAGFLRKTKFGARTFIARRDAEAWASLRMVPAP